MSPLNPKLRVACAALSTMLLASTASAQDEVIAAASDRRDYSPFVGKDYPDRILFGDAHVHTSFSPDAGMAGTRLLPGDAYRFAKGELVTSSTGIPVQLQRPLDWLAVTDHAENLGLPVAIVERNPDLVANEWGRLMAELFSLGTTDAARAAIDSYQKVLNALEDPLEGTDFGRSSWHRIIEAAEVHDAPGRFTTLIGFEWTPAPGGANLHRNVLFRDGKQHAEQIVPISAYDTEDPEKLWDWMQAYEQKTGGRLIAVAHNGNLSNGLMFDDTTRSGKELSAEYGRRRTRFEPIYEVTQTKGDGEAHSFLSPEDEFADFETWDKGSFGPVPKSPEMLPREYAREALKRGLAYEERLGVNPFKFGMIGSTDSHTGLSTVEESNFFGKIAALEPTADPIRFDEPVIGRLSKEEGKIRAWKANAGGLVAVWARENTREEIFDAMARKEVYATTGTRIRVRVFGGFGFRRDALYRPDLTRFGYENGVPMGGDLRPARDGEVPSFVVRAMRDPDGANLDRIQIVKGWLDRDGEVREQVFDAACAGGRSIIASTHRCDGPVGNTVDLAHARYTNAIGASMLEAYWKDPDFDPVERAFYYVRVLEIPTPRWTVYDAKFFGVKLRDGDPRIIQERAYTSPIWYSPR